MSVRTAFESETPAMTTRERILSVYQGKTPDCVPFMLDLSHWFYHRHRLPWDLSRAYDEPEHELIEYHRQVGAGFYLPNLGSFFSVSYSADVRSTVSKSDDGREITWTFETPLGVVRRRRRWEETSYAWGIPDWGLKTQGGRSAHPRVRDEEPVVFAALGPLSGMGQ